MTTRLKIYKTMVIPTIYHNIETWNSISKKEMKELEDMQGIILKKYASKEKPHHTEDY